MSCTTTKKGLTSVIFNCLSYNLTVISVNYILSHKWTHFQSNTREVDLDLTREQYMSDIYRLNDFLFHIGNYNYRIVSAIPEKALSYTTMLKPFDIYIWTSIVVSVASVLITMVAIEKNWDMLMGNLAGNSIHQCKCKQNSK